MKISLLFCLFCAIRVQAVPSVPSEFDMYSREDKGNYYGEEQLKVLESEVAKELKIQSNGLVKGNPLDTSNSRPSSE